MGFGLIFAGYISFFCMRLIPVDIFGFLLIYLGLKKLSIYNNHFKKARKISIICLVYSVLYGVFQIIQLAKLYSGPIHFESFYFYENIIYYSLLFLLHFHMYKAFSDICEFCDLPTGVKKSNKCLSTATVYYAFTFIVYILKLIPVESALYAQLLNSMYLALNILMLLWFCMTTSLIYTCYRNIVTDEILENEQEKIAKFNKRFDLSSKKNKKQ